MALPEARLVPVGGRRLLTVKQDRPVDPGWSCQRSGDCCKSQVRLIMRVEERDAMQEYADQHLTMGQLSRLKFVDDRQPGFVALVGTPCPMHDDADGQSKCMVYPARPFNCRRFGCMRPDPASEPLEVAPLAPVLHYGNVGCVNLRERLLYSRAARRCYELLYRKARRWAEKHGWTE